MNVGKIMQFATEGLKAMKSMPLSGKVAMGALLGVTGIAGALIGDSFEKEGNIEGKGETTLVTQPKELADSTKVKKEPDFIYNPPEVGEVGIASSDTAFYTGTKQPASIMYYDENGNLRHQTEYTKKGEFAGYYEGKDSNNFTHYDNKGNFVDSQRVFEDGRTEYVTKSHGLYETNIYDKQGRTLRSERATKDYEMSRILESDHYNIERTDFTYNEDGSWAAAYSPVGMCKYTNIYDKNDRLIKTKEYNKDGELARTIVPKYNSEGDIVRRDTIPNE